MANRYEYNPCKLAGKDTIHHFVVDKEPPGFWNTYRFESEEEALQFITNKTVVYLNTMRTN